MELNPLQRARFWSKVDKSAANGCWEWAGTITPKGYGVYASRHARSLRAHRVSWELLRGPIQTDLTIDHLCRNKRCVNPDHLEPVTAAVNTLRGDSPPAMKARQTHCEAGHPLIRRSDGHRECRICKQEADRQRPPRSYKYGDRFSRGLCVQCCKPSSTYRCSVCRETHNERNKGRKR